ncbi:GerAB/ArcD/ProY family transporter [Peribacillus sp. SI8-4]|uniref:GerAB/ArcD/ProY family transporter n=1 Tax=Peribacillus sp. SI8-4 TaxID=3048009 RepID=UPI002556DC1C|nr:GerAB/ArcD/ProY family transporter [Peribacillus sp. SI8-4]
MVNKSERIPPYFVFFLVVKVQTGTGVLGFQRLIMHSAGNDAWIAVIFGGIVCLLPIWCMFNILHSHEKDLIGVHKQIFGKYIGGILSMIWIIFWLMLSIAAYMTYAEIIGTWLFPQINILPLSIVFAIVIYYAVSGGFRIIAGLCFLGVILTSFLILTIYFPIGYAQFHNLLPIWHHSIKEMAIGTKDMSLSYLGFSTMLMYYPFIDPFKKAKKWAYMGNLTTMLFYSLIMVLTIGYFTEAQIERYIWPTLNFWSSVKIPFVERFEYVGITMLMFSIVPIICLTIWAAIQGTGRLFNVKSKKITFLYLIILIAFSLSLNSREEVNSLLNFLGNAGLYLYLVYIPALYFITLIMSKRTKKGRDFHEN